VQVGLVRSLEAFSDGLHHRIEPVKLQEILYLQGS
jgi:hypothetical protein